MQQRSRLGEEVRRDDINKRIEEFRSDDEEDSEIFDKKSIPVAGSGDQAL
jgi:hypothetical protein